MSSEQVRPPVCIEHLTFLKCVHAETQLPTGTFTCPRHKSLFNQLHLKLKQLTILSNGPCFDECFYSYVQKEISSEHQDNGLECQGVCMLQYLHDAMEANSNGTLV